ncbi:MAG: MmgE/PrpD family protein [Roseovarius sp.]
MADLAARFAEFALGAAPDEEALAVMRLSLLDWAAVGIAGQGEPVSDLLREQALEEGGREEAAIFGSEIRVPGRMAALVNGTVAHALDYDDTHFAHIGHPSVAVVPAALAAAQIAGAGGMAFQQAALLGAEASVRIGVWLGREHYQTGFHQTGTAGAFGAAVAAGRLLDLDEGQMQMALGLVSTRASGLKSQFGTMGKPMNAGIAAQNGLEAALLARRGFVSNPAAIDGPQGFGPTHHGMADAAGLEGLGDGWLFPGVHHKFHACCHGLHAALEAIATLPDTPEPIEAITVHTHPRWLSVCNIEAPKTGLEAKFSYRVALSMALCGRDTALLDSFSAETCADAEIEEMRRRTEVEADDSLSEMQARVIVTLADGNARELYHDLDADPGLSVRRQKVQDKAARLIGKAKAEAIRDVLDRAASPEDFAALIAG